MVKKPALLLLPLLRPNAMVCSKDESRSICGEAPAARWSPWNVHILGGTNEWLRVRLRDARERVSRRSHRSHHDHIDPDCSFHDRNDCDSTAFPARSFRSSERDDWSFDIACSDPFTWKILPPTVIKALLGDTRDFWG